MKKHIHLTKIGLLVVLMAVIVACNPPEEKDVEPMEMPIPELAAIDSLMWQQPDSAFAMLQEFVVSPEAKDLDVYNEHYCQLLISELLYKNDYIQSNRENLMQAVDYFDSLCAGSDAARHVSTDPTIAFLDARSHYINGVGFYEQKNIVQACSEYLNVLEIMEGNFQDQTLTGIRAKFMFYTYNRLLELFSAQFMMASAIKCGEEALAYCQKEPSLSKEIPNTYFHIGKQYDKMGEKNIARDYYGRSIEGLSDINSLVYRDAISMKALCDYQVGHDVDSSLTLIRQMLAHANNEKERLTRLIVIGGIFTIEQSFDSALYYLKPVFENKDDISFQIQAAEYLLIIYDNLGNKEKSNECTRFLADFKKTEGENKAMVSKLEDLFKTYTIQKQEKEAEEKRKTAIKKILGVIIPIAAVLASIIIVLAKVRSKKLLKQQQEEADKVLEETEQQHRMQQAAMSGRLKKSNEEVRELKDQIKQMDDLAANSEMAASFNEEPICRLIMERVHDGQFKSKIDCDIYKSYALDKQQLLDLRMAVDRHFSQFTLRLRKAYPKLTSIDIDYCCLYLLNLTYADVSALMQRAYNTVVERDGKIKKILGSDNPLPYTLIAIANESLFS